MLQTLKTQRFLLAILFSLSTAISSVSSADVDKASLDAVKADLQGRIDESKLSGAVVMVAQDGEVLMHEALGYQNVEDQIPMSTDTIFRIFSMTVYFAYAIANTEVFVYSATGVPVVIR